MEPMGSRSAPGFGAAGCYVWQPPGKPVAIYLELDVVDKVLPEAMRGLTSVPKRGAEVGGVLLGTAEAGEQLVVHVQDVEPVACEYKMGPSYVLSERDLEMFDEACQRWEWRADSPIYAVGYYRSQTREGTGLGQEDLDLCATYFTDPSNVVLLIRPFATRVSMAGFLYYEDGKFQDAPYLEFPFRRRELAGEEAPPHRPLQETRTRGSEAAALEAPPPRAARGAEEETGIYAEEEPRVAAPRLERRRRPEPAHVVTTPAKGRFEKKWVWIPLSFIFLLLGVLLGFQAALSIGAKSAGGPGGSPLTLGLTVSVSGENLRVSWNRQAPAIKAASTGRLEIDDGDSHTPMELDSSQLQSLDNIIYRHRTDHVHVSLEVSPSGGVTLTQTADWNAQ